MKRTLVRASLAAMLAFGMSAVFAAPGGAVAHAQTCTHVTGSATFSPGLGSTPKNNTVKAKGTETGCTPKAATGGSGTITATIVVKGGSCAKLATGKQKLIGTGQTAWHNKKVSKYSLTFTTGTGSNITLATITGKVTSGLFVGHKISAQVRFTVKSGQNCTTVPVKNITFKNTKPFIIV